MSFKQRITKDNSLAKNSAKQGDSSAWLVSFADLLSLILAFFVLVYSMSDIPHKKWTQYSSSIVEYITGNKLNIFKQEIKVTEKDKSKKLSSQHVSSSSYIKTLLDGMEIEGKPLNQFVNYSILGRDLVISFNKDLIYQKSGIIKLSEEGISIFLSLSKIFQILENQIIVDYPLEDYNKSVNFSNFIARKIEEFGYEYKVLRGIYFYNIDLSKKEISNDFQVIISDSENIL